LYYVHLSEKANRFLEKLDTLIKDRIKERLKRLEENPVP